MQREEWLLIIEYDDFKTQFERDPELAFPNDEVSQVVGRLHDWGGYLPEDFSESVFFTETQIKITFDTLQGLEDLLTFIVHCTIPKSMTLTRE